MSLVKKTASCADMLTWFEANNQRVQTPEPGDVVFFKFKTNNRRTNHVGLVIGVRGNTVITIEGNTSVNSDDNGGSVMKRERSKNIVAYGRPAYASSQDRDKLINLAKSECGTTEWPPNSNNVKYNTWFYKKQVSGAAYPWCAAFISWLFDQLPSKSVVNEQVPKVNTQNKPTLRKGSTGPYVKLVQELLSLRGYILKVDGIFGPATEAYVKSFQKANKLEDDGIVGPLTWDKLSK